MPQPNLTDWEERALPRWLVDPDTGQRIGGLATPIYLKDTWTLANISNTTLNSTNKHFTVPAATVWQILYVYVVLSTTATAGNRQIEVQWWDNTNVVIGSVVAGAVQAASNANWRYMFAPALADLTAFRDTTFLMSPLPPTLFLTAGESLRVWDNKAIDNNADDMNVYIKYATRTA